MGCCEEGFGASEGPQTELSPIFQPVEHAFDDVPRFVECGVVFDLNFAVLSRRDARDCLGVCQPIAQMICVIAAICDNCAAFSDIGFKALACLRNIRSVTCRQAKMNRATATIAYQMQLGIQPAFGFADAASFACVFFTPFAAIRCVLM